MTNSENLENSIARQVRENYDFTRPDPREEPPYYALAYVPPRRGKDFRSRHYEQDKGLR